MTLPSISIILSLTWFLKDEKGPNFNLDDFKEAEQIYVTEDAAILDGSNVLKSKQLKSLDNSVLTQLNAAEAYISQTLHGLAST